MMDDNQTYCGDHLALYTYNKIICTPETNTMFLNQLHFSKTGEKTNKRQTNKKKDNLAVSRS